MSQDRIAALKLAETMVNFDEDNPGEANAEMIVPAEVWAEWIDLCGKIQAEVDA